MIGLIGGMGAGKSRLAALFAEWGAQVLDADAIGHALLDQTPARDEVVARFGEGVLDLSDPEAPRIDRKRLGKIVFSEPALLKVLESILHPRMRLTFQKAIGRAARKRQARAVVLDAAILLEARWDDLCDVVLFVEAPEAARLERLQQSRGWSAEAVEARQKAQKPLDEKRGKADFVIENAGDLDALAASARPVWDRLTASPSTRRPTRDRGPRARPTTPNEPT